MVLWWEKVVKINTKRRFIGEGTKKRREEMKMENFYYACLYEALKQPIQDAEKKTMINRIQAKIVQIHAAKLQWGQVELKTKTYYKRKECPLSTDQEETAKERGKSKPYRTRRTKGRHQ